MRRVGNKEKGPEKEKASGKTIVAVSTAPGLGAVALVRLSGARAWALAREMVGEKEKFDRLEERKNKLFTLKHPHTREKLDTALVVKYREPESFTGEDVVEFQCHGGNAVPSALTEAAISAGARAAKPGEFTRRAFLNGKIDLVQAEAIDDLVHSRSELGRRLALSGLSGKLGKEITKLRKILLDLQAELEYSIDFPEEAQTGDLQKKTSKGIKEAVKAIDKLLDRAKRNIMLNRGALTVIAGEPNVGKSSLFNALLGKERAIVTEEAGTTRDAVEMETMIGGYLFRLVDTAGLRKSGNKAEKIGVEYSRKFIDEADLVLFVHEAGADLKKVEKEFLKSFEKKSILRIINKIDLMDKKTKVPDGYIPVSAKMGKGIKELKEDMVRMVLPEKEKQKTPGGPQVISLRQKNLLEGAKNVLEGTDQRLSAEFIVSDLEEAGDFLGELTGQITSEEVLDEIFSRFCIGK